MNPVKVLAVRYLANASPALCRGLGAPEGYPALGLLTTDCDDATYIALDAATKAAQVEVAYARSFYPGASLKDDKTVCYEAGDWYEMLRFCHFVLSDG